MQSTLRTVNNFFPLFGGDYGIVQTVNRMKALVYSSMRAPNQPVRKRAENVLRFVNERDDLEEIRALFNFVQGHFHYLNDPFDIELIKSPEVSDAEITATGFFMGDCDDASTYLAALLKSVGYAPYFAVAAPWDAESFDLSHVYVKIVVPATGDTVALDPTAKGKPFGWEVRTKRVETYAV